MQLILSVAFFCMAIVTIKAEALEEATTDPFEQCRVRCDMPASSAVWAAGAKSKHPVVQNRRQKQAFCADTCICSTYCATLLDAGMPIDSVECNTQCVLRKPFSSQPDDWAVFFGEDN